VVIILLASFVAVVDQASMWFVKFITGTL
jgi:hypothetical protein